jgi:hypothetical protein
LGMLNWLYKWYDPKGRLNVQEVAKQFMSLALAGLAADRPRTARATSKRDTAKSSPADGDR